LRICCNELASSRAGIGRIGGGASEVFVLEPGPTQFSYLPETIRVREGAEGKVRSVTMITRNPETSPLRAANQLGASAVMECVCARRAAREMMTTSIKRSGAEVVAVLPGAARLFADTKPGSLERKLADAVCQAEL
jgi:hypothetical protein